VLLFKQYIATMVLERWVMSFDLHLYLILSMYNQMGGYTLKKTWFEAFVYFIIKKMEHIKLKFWRVFIKRVHCLWLSNLSGFIWVILKANFFFSRTQFSIISSNAYKHVDLIILDKDTTFAIIVKVVMCEWFVVD